MNNKGSIMILVFMSIALLTILAGSSVYITVNEYYSALRNMESVEMYYLAEAGSELVARSIAEQVANYNSEPAGATDEWTALCGNTNDFLSSGYDLSYSCDSVNSGYKVTENGLVTFVRHYRIESTVINPATGISSSVSQVVARNKTYTFQHAVFYTGDLEMVPGPDMTLSGKVHSNGDIYMDSHNKLTVDSDYLCSAGNIYKKRKDNGQELSGNVSILKDGTSTFKFMRDAGDTYPLDCDRTDWIDESQIRWNGTVKSSAHGITALTAPSVASIASDGYYSDQAGLKVVNGNLFSGSSQLVEGTDMPVGTLVISNTFYNNREGKNVKMTTIDMEKLAGWEDAADKADGIPSFPNQFPDNGLLYATVDDQSGGEQPGVRLINGSEMESGSNGLTVVSNVPLYVQGDYNAVNKKPAAVISDAVNILSNLWSDASSTLSLNSRVADNTTINLAMISGIVPTPDGGGTYSGGLENLPRFHEKWTGKNLSLRGSFVVLWDSEVATGDWSYGGDVYKAPTRDWDYDPDFNDEDNLPPFTPFAVETSRVVWWKG